MRLRAAPIGLIGASGSPSPHVPLVLVIKLRGMSLLAALMALTSACHPRGLLVMPYAPATAPAAMPDSIFGALGLPPLSTVRLPAGCEEVRINVGNGPARGSEAPALRLTRCGGRVRGEVATFRRVIDPRYPCTWPQHGNFCVGRGRFSAPPDWSGFWNLLDSLAIWELPSYREVLERSRDHATPTHSGHLHLEWLRAGEFRSWEYEGFDDRAWPEARKVAAVDVTFDRMRRQLEHTPSNLIHEYPP